MPSDELGSYVLVATEKHTVKVSVNSSMSWGHVRRDAWLLSGVRGGDLFTSDHRHLDIDALVSMDALPDAPLVLRRAGGPHAH